MIGHGIRNFEETDDAIVGYIERTAWRDDDTRRFKAELELDLRRLPHFAAVEYRDLADKNWNEAWERTVQPVEVGEKLVIAPSWSRYENTANRIVIRIDPKMAFGTGYHESTRLMLQLIEKHTRPCCEVLDVGTGTGILAIAAVKLGASGALAIDIDEWSIMNATENVAANGLGSRVRISDCTVSSIARPGAFGLILANLTLQTIIGLLPELSRLATENGILLLSDY